MFPPNRIVCLSAETVETLYLLGEQDRIVGITGFAERPPRARRDKPKVAAFNAADIDAIRALDPDLVLTFSDVQADIAAHLIRAGIAVHAFNQRSIAGILDMVRTIGVLVGAGDRAARLAGDLAATVEQARHAAQALPRRPKIYFEEWNDPLICGIGWVCEMIELAGGIDVFADRARAAGAKERVVAPDDIIARAPDIIICSWCGKKFRPETVKQRAGFASIPAIETGNLHEIKSSIILQPGPGAITAGLPALHSIVGRWAAALAKSNLKTLSARSLRGERVRARASG